MHASINAIRKRRGPSHSKLFVGRYPGREIGAVAFKPFDVAVG